MKQSGMLYVKDGCVYFIADDPFDRFTLVIGSKLEVHLDGRWCHASIYYDKGYGLVFHDRSLCGLISGMKSRLNRK